MPFTLPEWAFCTKEPDERTGDALWADAVKAATPATTRDATWATRALIAIGHMPEEELTQLHGAFYLGFAAAIQHLPIFIIDPADMLTPKES